MLWFDRLETRYVRAKIGLAVRLDWRLCCRYFQPWWRHCESKWLWGPEVPLHRRVVCGPPRPQWCTGAEPCWGSRGQSPRGKMNLTYWHWQKLIFLREIFSYFLKEHKAINLCGTFCFLKTLSRLLRLTVILVKTHNLNFPHLSTNSYYVQ